jgi:hypothetical protein
MIRSQGIRIFGALFCDDEVSLSGIDIPYPLVLDYGFFKLGIRATGFHTAGHFSVDNGVVLDNLALSKAKIDKGLFARRALIRYFTLDASEVGETVNISRSLITSSINLLTTVVNKDVDVSESSASEFELFNSSIAGRLNLSQTEMRCSYQLRKSQVGEIVIDKAGFGGIDQSKAFSWLSPDSSAHINLYRSFDHLIDEVKMCSEKDLWGKPSVFLMSDVHARSICFINFSSLRSVDGKSVPTTTIQVKATSATGNVILDVGHDAGSHTIFELSGVEGSALFVNFVRFIKANDTRVDDLRFKRIYEWQQGSCLSEPERIIPQSEDVTNWLDTDRSHSSLQPYVALAASFENAGQDATDIKVAKAKIEHRSAVKQTNDSVRDQWDQSKSIVSFLSDHGLNVFNDYLRLGSNWVLGQVADYGYRPAKAFWIVFGLIILARLIFRYAIGIVAFMPEKKSDVRQVGCIFLFDHLIPAYRIRDDNYGMGKFYTTPNRSAAGAETISFRSFGRSIKCAPAQAWQVRWTDSGLAVLKALGIVLAVFLVAAINALVNH